MTHLIAPSILASDFGKLQSEIKMLNESEAGELANQRTASYPTNPNTY